MTMASGMFADTFASPHNVPTEYESDERIREKKNDWNNNNKKKVVSYTQAHTYII